MWGGVEFLTSDPELKATEQDWVGLKQIKGGVRSGLEDCVVNGYSDILKWCIMGLSRERALSASDLESLGQGKGSQEALEWMTIGEAQTSLQKSLQKNG